MRAKIFATWISLFLVGSMLAVFFRLDPGVWLFLGLLIIISSFFVINNRLFWAVIFGIGCLLVAVGMFQNQEIKYINVNREFTGKRILVGTVVDIPQETEKGVKARLKVGKNEFLVYLRPNPKVEYADTLEINGTVKEFSKEKESYLIKEKLGGEVNVLNVNILGKNTSWDVRARGILFWFRTRMNQEIARALPKEEAGLASGLILGEKTLVSAEITRLLQASGTSHVIALSGYNITIILSLFLVIKNRASRLMNLLIPATFVVAFVIMTGGAASIVRAAIMGCMPIVARYLGRPANGFMAIIFSAFLMVLVNPFIALYDVGFQLSFMAMVGLVYISPLIINVLKKRSPLTEAVSQTLAAQVAVLPLLIYYFGVFSVIAPVSNLIVLSLVPLGMLLSFLAGFGGMIFPVLGKMLALIAYPVLKLFNQLIAFFGGLPYASFQFKIDSPIWVLIFYLILFDLLFLVKKKTAPTP